MEGPLARFLLLSRHLDVALVQRSVVADRILPYGICMAEVAEDVRHPLEDD